MSKALPGLEEVVLNWCDNISQKALLALTKNCDNLKTIRYHGRDSLPNSVIEEIAKAGVSLV